MSDFRRNSSSSSRHNFDSFSDAPIPSYTSDSQQDNNSYYNDSYTHTPKFVHDEEPDDQGYIGGISTAYSGPKVGFIPPKNAKPLGPRLYRPDESTAYSGPRGGFTYGGELLFTDTHKATIEPPSPPMIDPRTGQPIPSAPRVGRIMDFSLQKGGKNQSHQSILTKKIKLLGSIITATLLILGTGIYWFIFRDTRGNPGIVVQNYFQALSHNNAAGALKLGFDQPEDTTYLTEDTLKLQNMAAKIELPTITHIDFHDATSAAVKFTIKIGEQVYPDNTIEMVKNNNTWLLSLPALSIPKNNFISSTDIYGSDLLSIDDTPLPPTATNYYFFPGQFSISLTDAKNQALELKDTSIVLPPNFTEHTFPQLTLHIRRIGHSKKPIPQVVNRAKGAVARAFKTCIKSHSTHPPHCPFHISSFGHLRNSVEWEYPELKNGHLPLIYNYGPVADGKFNSQITVRGWVKVPWTAKARSEKTTIAQSGTVHVPINATISILGIDKYVCKFYRK